MPEVPKPMTEPRQRRANHILDAYFIGPAQSEEVLEIWGYTDQMSYFPGDQVDLRVSTTADYWDLEIGRDGQIYETVLKATGLNGVHHATPVDCYASGCGWPVSYSFTVPLDWRPGGYLITLRGFRGNETVEEHHLILIRRTPDAQPAPYLLICATATWVAYNCWGGANAYEGIAETDGASFSPVLSTQRPWSRGFCRLPQGAPRALTEQPATPGDMARYPYMEWAHAYGYSKKYASAGWASYERHFAHWAEAEGFSLDFATQHDLAADPSCLDGYACVIIVGHDEYWSRDMRTALDRFTQAGGHVARFAGNFFWQIRLEDKGRRQVCYKYIAKENDPVAGTDRAHLLTGAWDEPAVGWPGAQSLGANGTQGIYAGLGKCVGQGTGGFTIYRPDHWALSGAGLGYGDVLGASSRILGYEVDGLAHIIEDGLPRPTGTDGASEDIEIIGMGLGTNVEADHDVWGETLYIGRADAEWLAEALHGELTSDTYNRVSRGNGVMIHWARGKGEIFNAATCEWVAGLIRRDTQVEQVTRNVLRRFAKNV
jgi:hypothetical protein